MNISNHIVRNMRCRLIYFVAVVITIILGLTSRTFGELLPTFLASNLGDALWAAMVYFGFRSLLVEKSRITAFLLSFLFSFGIEFSQLYQEDWLNQIRETRLGGLILGRGFLVVDLIRYSIGIMIAGILDWWVGKISRESTK